VLCYCVVLGLEVLWRFFDDVGKGKGYERVVLCCVVLCCVVLCCVVLCGLNKSVIVSGLLCVLCG